MFSVKPSLASDFEQKISSDDLVFQGAALATRILNDRYKIGAGVISTTQFGNPRIIPAINFHYKKNRHEINSLLPLNFKYTYRLLPSEKLELGLKYTLKGANFNIYDKNLPNVDKINYSRVNVGILTNYQITKMFRIEVFGGISTNRKYNFVDVNDNTLEFDSKASPFFSVGIVLVSPKRK